MQLHHIALIVEVGVVNFVMRQKDGANVQMDDFDG